METIRNLTDLWQQSSVFINEKLFSLFCFQAEFRGATGLLSFDSENQRKIVELTIKRMTRQKVEKVSVDFAGFWYSLNGFRSR